MSLGKKNRRFETLKISPRIAKNLVFELKLQAKQRRTTESGLIEAALRTFLSQTEHESVIDRRLNKVQEQNEKIKLEQRILLETLAAFVKTYFMHTVEIPYAQKLFSEEKDLVRFEQFMVIIANAFKNETLFMEVIDERIVTEKDSGNEVIQ